MVVRVLVGTVAALLWGTAAFGACVPTKQHGCEKRPAAGATVDLSAIPNIAQEVVGTEKLPAPREKTQPTLPDNRYNGPTIGFSNAVRRAPEIKYQWQID